MNRREGFLGDECRSQCLTETWSVELKKKTEASIKQRLVKKKKIEFFLDLNVRENPDKTRLTSSYFADPLWFASLC